MQRRRYPGPEAILLALLTGLIAGCAPSQPTGPDETQLQERHQRLSGSEPYLVRDLNPTGQGSRPDGGAVAAQDRVFFARNAAESELWKSDGTQAGTVLVKRFQYDQYKLQLLSAMEGTVFFQDLLHSTLWKSDGTEAGTVRLTPVNHSTNMGNLPLVRDSAVLNGRLYLLTATSLWVSDGTATGTVSIKTLPVDSTSPSGRLVAANGLLFFTVYPPSGGAELWKSDGTAAGTARLKAISNEPVLSRASTHELVALNSTLFVTAYSDSLWSLWKSDGTVDGTVILQDGLPSIGGLTISNGRLYYETTSALWTTDGTKDGTRSLTSRAVTTNSLMATSGGLVFSLYQDDTGVTLWRSNGTVADTTPLADPCPGSTHGSPARLAGVNGVAFFSLSCGTAHTGLWKSDGTASGTRRVTDTSLWTGDNSTPTPTGTISVDMGGTLFFWADDDRHGLEPWKSDGTASSTVLVRDIIPTPASSNPHDFVAMGGSVFFTAEDSRNGLGLWKSDGTADGTVRLTSLSPWDNTALLTPVNGTLFFAQHSGQLWKSDGTTAGTLKVRSFTPSMGSDVKLLALTDFGGTLFFALQDDGRTELWKSDGSEAGTMRVKELPRISMEELPNSGKETQVAYPRVVNGSLFFIVGYPAENMELWKSDGTEAGTVRVKTLFNGYSRFWTWMHSVAVADGKYFALIGSDLWMSNGTEAGTTLLTNVMERVHPIALAEANGTLLLLSSETNSRGDSDIGLWKSNGMAGGTTRLRTLFSKANQLVGFLYSANVRGRQYLILYSPERKDYELWRSDGTAESTSFVYPMELSSSTSTGLIDFAPLSQTPPLFAEVGKRLLFVRNGGQGRELWALPLAPVDCPSPALVVQASGPNGAHVEFPTIRRADDVDPALSITYSHASGSLFPLGDTPVTLTASHPAYPANTCTFSISVRDSLGPTVQCPANLSVDAPLGKDGVSIQYPPATAADAVSTPVLEYSHASGSTFPIGITTVEVKATDAAGNVTTCAFKVDVAPPLQRCGCGSTSPAAAFGWLMVLVPLVLRRRGARG
ncbi:ELWxxDGT repeat protein [Archangium gephyra]|nr:ELWxxDGT repeat protein [Archangium gephyra]REG31993.1 ELWxxDGT repeat protein [Archangium gephyra]